VVESSLERGVFDISSKKTLKCYFQWSGWLKMGQTFHVNSGGSR